MNVCACMTKKQVSIILKFQRAVKAFVIKFILHVTEFYEHNKGYGNKMQEVTTKFIGKRAY